MHFFCKIIGYTDDKLKYDPFDLKLISNQHIMAQPNVA